MPLRLSGTAHTAAGWRGCSTGSITVSPPSKHDPEKWRPLFGKITLNNTLPSGEVGMAEHAEVQYATATGNDYPAHEQTYRNFVTLVKVSLAIVVVILILMAFFLT
jgi:hypothetical protein